MHWEDGSVSVLHRRGCWGLGGDDDETLVHCRLDELKGTAPEFKAQKATYSLAYNQAKRNFDLDVAYEIIERCVSSEVIDRIVDIVYYSKRQVIIVFPHVSFDDEDGDSTNGSLDAPTNALPFAYARFLAETCGLQVNESIIQIARVGRTRLPKWVRFLCQPAFEGAVDANAAYFIVDDVISTGGTFAALRSYIIGNGGTVAGTTALANKDGLHQKFAIADETVNMLVSAYGPGLHGFWARTFGHGIANLTEAEGRFLLGAVNDEWPGAGAELLQRLRERINQAAATFR